MHTKESLKKQLAAMGLTGEETILIHSSMKAIGETQKGADTVLDALMEFFEKGLFASSDTYMEDDKCGESCF